MKTKEATSKATHARVAGRDAVALRTIWYIEIGALRFRCILQHPREAGASRRYDVECRDSSGLWGFLCSGDDPQLLLRRIVSPGKAVGGAIEHKVKLAAESLATALAGESPY